MRILARVVRHRWGPVPGWALTDSKFDRILQLATGKDVLDCGCVGSRLEDPSGVAATSHYQIARVARRCVGVDIVADEVAKRRDAGYDVRVANVETMDLGETFDVVVAADLIEHLSNAGSFLDRAAAHLRDDGLLCLVTPNLWSANTVLKSLAGLRVAVNAEHTCWYDPVTLVQLLRRHNFEPVEWYWQDYRRQPVVALLTAIRPNLAAHFIAICRKGG